MNIYDAIFTRKSVRRFLTEPVEPKLLDEIMAYARGLSGFIEGIETEFLLVENPNLLRSFGIPGIKAPYYLALYTQEQDKKMMNGGYLLEQMSLYLLTKGLGSCFFGSARLPRNLRERNGKSICMLLAFGKERPGKKRRAERLELSKICIWKDMPKPWAWRILEAARSAPSAYNSQPWRFLVRDNRIHVFSRKMEHRLGGRYKEFAFGAMFCHVMVAAEEFWLDIDLIRLENISQKSFANAEYVLSMILLE